MAAMGETKPGYTLEMAYRVAAQELGAAVVQVRLLEQRVNELEALNLELQLAVKLPMTVENHVAEVLTSRFPGEMME